jgi:hypothetical protein
MVNEITGRNWVNVGIGSTQPWEIPIRNWAMFMLTDCTHRVNWLMGVGLGLCCCVSAEGVERTLLTTVTAAGIGSGRCNLVSVRLLLIKCKAMTSLYLLDMEKMSDESGHTSLLPIYIC